MPKPLVLSLKGFGRFEMLALLVCLSAVTPLAGLGLVLLQERLERWAYERHAQD
ncbi:hypothetical protein [Mycobacterium haemophilum]|uniref:hypothetical protein n=1 Tax=Mycobacterium haemophilum TaxID=29311 RepID=UPI0012E036E3|nr:hypothetical protein [Mycobacterium haemophilum]MCV7342695.1 hypothetical protein [Mycobacterium haemophilum DSM 44634]